MSHSRCVKLANRLALTLLELVVVLGILAVLSTVAVRSLEPIADQARYELTQTVLNDLRYAVAGDSNRVHSYEASVPAGFVMNCGILPTSVEDLSSKPVALAAYTVQSFDSDRDTVNDVTLASGWNGPYMHLKAGATEVVDGWGNELVLNESGGDMEIVSYGADGDSIAPEDGYLADLSVNILTRDYTGDLVFRLFAIDGLNGSRVDPSPSGTEQLGVLFYGVNSTGGTTGEIAEQLLIVSNSGAFEFRRSSTLCGRIAARAILWDDVDGDDELDIGESIVRKSYVHFAVVSPSAETRLEMELR